MARRDLDSSGQPVAKLLKVTAADVYSAKVPRVIRIQLRADAIDEPTNDNVVPLLEALNPEERAFHADESNVVELSGKSSVVMAELEQQYGFVDGSTE